MDLKRLSELVYDGDLSVGSQLQHTVLRAGREPSTLVLEAAERGPLEMARMITALQALDAAVELVAHAWKEERWDEVEHLGQGLGVQLTEARCQKMNEIMAEANYRRRVRKVAPRHLLRAMALAVRSPEGWAFEHAGKAGGKTGAAFAAVRQNREHLTVGGATSNASNPSPGSGWSELAPWRPDLEERCREKALDWAEALDSGDRMAVPLADGAADIADGLQQGAFGQAEDEMAQVIDGVPPDSPVMEIVEDGPGRSAFNRLVSLLNKTKKKELDELREQALSAIEDWPEEERVATGRSLKSLAVDHRKGRWRPGFMLCRGMEVKGRVPEKQVDAILKWPHTDKLSWLSIDESGEKRGAEPTRSNSTVRILREPEWKELKKLTLRLQWTDELVDLLDGASALDRARELELDVNRDENNMRVFSKTTQKVPELFSSLGHLESLTIRSLGECARYPHDWARWLKEQLETLTSLKSLRLIARFGDFNLKNILASSTVGNLESLYFSLFGAQTNAQLEPLSHHQWQHLHTLGFSGFTPNSQLVERLAEAPLSRVRRLKMKNGYQVDLATLAGTDLVNGLESLDVQNAFTGLETLLEESELSSLQELRVSGFFRGPVVTAIGNALQQGCVVRLEMEGSQYASAIVDLLATLQESPLRHLAVRNMDLRPYAARLVESFPAGLESLDLEGAYLSSSQLRDLRREPKFRQTEVVG